MDDSGHLARGIDREKPVRPLLRQVELDQLGVDILDTEQDPGSLRVRAGGNALDGEVARSGID
jgi:hypothetical protein